MNFDSTKNTKTTNLFDCKTNTFLKFVFGRCNKFAKNFFDVDTFVVKRSLMLLLLQIDAILLLTNMTIY